MNALRSFLAAIAIAAALAAPAASADTVFMQNGDRLSGKVLHMSADKLTLDTPYAGNIELPWSKVASLALDRPATLILKNGGGTRQGRVVRSQAGYFTFHPVDPQAPGRRIALGRVKYLNPTPAESGSGVEYKGRVTLSASRVQGNSSGSTFNGEAALRANASTYRYALRGSVNQAALAGHTVTSNWLVSTHVDRFVVDRKHFQYLRASLQRDRFQDIRLRSAVGGGYGWQLVDSAATDLNLRGGLDLVSAYHYANPNHRYPALGWGVHFSHWLWDRRVKVFHDQDGYWDLSRIAQVTLRTRTGLRVPVAHGLMATTELDVNWDRHPPPGVKATDSTLLFGLGYQW